MTALPAIKPLPLPERNVEKPLIPATCWDPAIPTYDGYSLIKCDELAGLLSWWMNGGAGHGPAWHEVFDHIHTCPACRAVSASLPAVQASVPRAWLPKQLERMET